MITGTDEGKGTSMKSGDNSMNLECVICREELIDELWTCRKCNKKIHHACLTKYLDVLQSQSCECALPGLCSCRPAPMCPLCCASVPRCRHDARASVRHTGVHTPRRAWWSVLVGAARRDRRARPHASVVGAAYHILMGRSKLDQFPYTTPDTHYI